jgi:hypothetical protein
VEPQQSTSESTSESTPEITTTEQRASAAHTPAGYRRCAMRLIRNQQLGMVLVYELEPSVADAGPRTLVFESGKWSMRLEHYPAEWRRLPDDQLLAMRTVVQA